MIQILVYWYCGGTLRKQVTFLPPFLHYAAEVFRLEKSLEIKRSSDVPSLNFSAWPRLFHREVHSETEKHQRLSARRCRCCMLGWMSAYSRLDSYPLDPQLFTRNIEQLWKCTLGRNIGLWPRIGRHQSHSQRWHLSSDLTINNL